MLAATVPATQRLRRGIMRAVAEKKPTASARHAYEVLARWDSEAGVWVAESEDVPGLVAEAESPNALLQKLQIRIPELLELNGVDSPPGAQFLVRYVHEESGVLAS